MVGELGLIDSVYRIVTSEQGSQREYMRVFQLAMELLGEMIRKGRRETLEEINDHPL